MEFINFPQQFNQFRTDYCTWLKSETGKEVTIKILKKSESNQFIVIKLALTSHHHIPHFFKLFPIGQRGKITNEEELPKEITRPINSNETLIKLNFFGIKKAKKEQAMRSIEEYFPPNEVDSIFKKNSSSVILRILLLDSQGQEIAEMSQELRVGKIDNEKIEIKFFTPQTLYDNGDNGEITFVLKQGIKDENETFRLKVTSMDNQYSREYKLLIQPAKNVVVFRIKIEATFGDHFLGQLLSEIGCSDLLDFNVREKNSDVHKRKSSPIKSCGSDVKMLRYDSCSESESGQVDAPLTNKRRLNNIITKKMLRDVAKVGHEFAFGKEINGRMLTVIEKVPIVCILQDDVKDTPLNNAILQNQEERANFLLDVILQNFPDAVNLVNTSGHTALILCPACDISSTFVKRLIDSGADLMAKDEDGNTALNIAIHYQKSDIFELLVNEANYRQLLRPDDDLMISLIKDILDNEFREGFHILSKNFTVLFNITNINECLSEKQINLYGIYEVDEIFNFPFVEFTPIEEVNFEQLISDVEDMSCN